MVSFSRSTEIAEPLEKVIRRTVDDLAREQKIRDALERDPLLPLLPAREAARTRKEQDATRDSSIDLGEIAHERAADAQLVASLEEARRRVQAVRVAVDEAHGALLRRQQDEGTRMLRESIEPRRQLLKAKILETCEEFAGIQIDVARLGDAAAWNALVGTADEVESEMLASGLQFFRLHAGRSCPPILVAPALRNLGEAAAGLSITPLARRPR